MIKLLNILIERIKFLLFVIIDSYLIILLSKQN